jgi:hypothetical protein
VERNNREEEEEKHTAIGFHKDGSAVWLVLAIVVLIVLRLSGYEGNEHSWENENDSDYENEFLFGAQRLDGIHSRGAACGEEAGEDCDGEQRDGHGAEGQRIARGDSVEF